MNTTTPSNRLDLSVQYVVRDPAVPTRPALRRWARAALAGGGSVTLRFVDAGEGRQLNHDYRGKDYATNVLSFPYETTPRLIGDIAICPDVVQREALEQGKVTEAHYAHLVVHAMLHLQGWDHEDDDAARAMEDEERRIMANLGFADPYQSDQ